MSAQQLPPSRIAGWFVACVGGGWLIVYNIMRLGGDDPATAALPALLVGGVIGLGVFAVGAVVVHRLHASGRVVFSHPSATVTPHPSAGAAVRLTAFGLTAAGVAAIVVGLLMGAEYLGIEGSRPTSTALLTVWNLAFGVWMLDEAWRLWREQKDPDARRDPDGHPAHQGLDAVWFAGLLTCVLAGVAFSRDILSDVQVALVVVVGAAGVLTGIALWRLRGGGGLPVAAAVAAVVAVASILLPAVA